MENPILSVIIPVYNAERTLAQCVDSVLAQPLEDFEILLVDDGSSDRSGEICNRYVTQNSRVRVFHKPNGGVSSARNMGLDKAQGKWVFFLDSDDTVAYNSLVSDNLIRQGGDLLLFSYEKDFPSKLSQQFRLKNAQAHTQEETRALLAHYMNDMVLTGMLSKLFRRDMIGKLRFDEHTKYGEDQLFTLQFVSRIQSCAISDRILYIYNSPSDTADKHQQSVSDTIRNLSNIINAYHETGISSPGFKARTYINRKCVCQQDIYRHPMGWYGNPVCQKLFKEIKGEFPLGYRLRNQLMFSLPPLSQLYYWWKRRRSAQP